MSRKKKIRPMMAILLEMETLIDEMIEDHDLQWGDVLASNHQHLMSHHPDARETYVKDGSHPEFYYGPRRKK